MQQNISILNPVKVRFQTRLGTQTRARAHTQVQFILDHPQCGGIGNDFYSFRGLLRDKTVLGRPNHVSAYNSRTRLLSELAPLPILMPVVPDATRGLGRGDVTVNERKTYRPKSAVWERMELPTPFQHLWELTLTLNLRLENYNQTFNTVPEDLQTVIGLNHSGSSS